MLHITNLTDGLDVFKALGYEVRIRIMNILLENNEMNMKELAHRLAISNGALTSHIRLLEECGLIHIANQQGIHGNQKICSINQDKILVELSHDAPAQNVYNVEYIIPNFIPYDQQIDEICISMELSSEAPGINENWPSDITFSLNGVDVAQWTSPGDFGEVRGLLTPNWWFPCWNQYGLLKMLQINKKGTFIDGDRKSNISIDSFHLTGRSSLRFRIAVLDSSANVGGLTIFGKTFGNYNQDIDVRITYSPLKNP